MNIARLTFLTALLLALFFKNRTLHAENVFRKLERGIRYESKQIREEAGTLVYSTRKIVNFSKSRWTKVGELKKQ
jgi:hypothetical protein